MTMVGSWPGIIEFQNSLPSGPARRAAPWIVPTARPTSPTEPFGMTALTRWASHVVSIHSGTRRRTGLLTAYTSSDWSRQDWSEYREEVALLSLPTCMGVTAPGLDPRIRRLFVNVSNTFDSLRTETALSTSDSSLTDFDTIRPALE